MKAKRMKRVIFGLMLALLTIGMLSWAFNIKPVRSTWTGTVYIRADGSIDPPDAPIITDDNVTYTLTGNITSDADGIVVMRGNIVIDGAGCTLRGSANSVGLNCSGINNVTIKNTNVKNFEVGILLYYSSNNSIADNNIANNRVGIYLKYPSSNNSIVGNNITANNHWGILLDVSSNNSIVGNNIENNDEGILLNVLYDSEGRIVGYSYNNSIVGNNIVNNHNGIILNHSYNNSIVGNNITETNFWGISLDYYSNNNSIVGNSFVNSGLYVWDSYGNVVVDNLVNGKPLIYLEGVSGYTIRDAGQVILINCSDILVENLNLSNTTVGVELWMTENTTIAGNNMENNLYGITLGYSSNNSIVGNNITANSLWGITLDYSSNNSIVGNNIENNGAAIYLAYSYDNGIVGNNIENNHNGIVLSLSSNNNSIVGNNITANNLYGIALDYSSNNSIVGNNITENNDAGIFLCDSSNNSIYHNNFINNAHQASSYNSVNIWDDGYPSGGNYWSNYTGIDEKSGPDQDEPGSDGIGDTPYIINYHNTDRYPLMHPYKIENFKFIIIKATTGGTTNPEPGTHIYSAGAEVNVTAFPNAGYSFDYWLFDGKVRTENPITVIMDSNHILEAYFVDDIPPEISEPWQDPPANNVQPLQNVTVRVNVTDYGTGIKNVTLWYSINNGTSWTILSMTALPIPSDTWITYEATIKGYENCTWVTYKIIAYDNAGNNATKDNNGYGYKYHVIPEYPSTLILVFIMATTLITTSILKIKKRRQLL